MSFDEYWQSSLKAANTLPGFQAFEPLLKEAGRSSWNAAILSAAKLTLGSAPKVRQ